MRKLLCGLLATALAFSVSAACAHGDAGRHKPPAKVLTVTGLVKNPLSLTLSDLARFEQTRVKINEITSEGNFNGVFFYRGVPLRNLLETAGIIKESGGGLRKPVDLALVITDRKGNTAVLGWGEVFYHNPGRSIIALSAQAIRPKHGCTDCHEKDFYQPFLDRLDRLVDYPKLVLADDFYTDRCLEGLVSIRVVEPEAAPKKPRPKKLFSPGFKVTGAVKNELDIKELPKLAPSDQTAKHVGEGKGFHGIEQYRGVRLKDLLKKAGVEYKPGLAVLASAPDGYQSLFSLAEVFNTPAGERLVVADHRDGTRLDEHGRFMLVAPADLWADRWVKALGSLKVVDLNPKPKVMVIGMGCGDNQLITLQTLAALARADVLVAPKEITNRFARYLAGKPVIHDPFATVGKEKKLTGPQRKKAFEAHAEKGVEAVKKALKEGKRVAVLDFGDPNIYGSWRWLQGRLPLSGFEMIPGISALNAGGAAMVGNLTCKGALVVTDRGNLIEQQGMLKTLSASGGTLAVFMAIEHLDKVAPTVRKYYPADTPVTFVFNAGYANKQKVLRTRLDKMQELAGKVPHQWLGTIYIGPCMKWETVACPSPEMK